MESLQLFNDVELSSMSALGDNPQTGGKKHARASGDAAPGADAWALEPHVCRHCFGRLVSQAAPGGSRYVCSNCGADAVGAGADALCCCGMKLRRPGAPGGLVDAGIRCQVNPAPTPEFPSLIIAAEAVKSTEK